MARDLQTPLEYAKWENVSKVADRAKDVANELTNLNVKRSELRAESATAVEPVKNNEDVRGLLVQRGGRPEALLT